ncbi:YopX family protein [Lactiplantibacillus plantarum]|uniref:YopX family protein n=1 Tax=Lactiplantibacillus plantarum TaxID=1590 RepID=UPI0024138EF4|nr:YopX family protein [Lactiplantibacillus plantarum]
MIKFRVWDKEDKAYTANKYLFEIVPDGKAFDLVSAVDFDDSNGLVIEQYTGLKDVNGKDVYEGDILENRKYRSIVKFASGKFLADLIETIQTFDLIGETHGSKVIGNVHENPELLKDKSL